MEDRGCRSYAERFNFRALEIKTGDRFGNGVIGKDYKYGHGVADFTNSAISL
jgi:hypothetical protein